MPAVERGNELCALHEGDEHRSGLLGDDLEAGAGGAEALAEHEARGGFVALRFLKAYIIVGEQATGVVMELVNRIGLFFADVVLLHAEVAAKGRRGIHRVGEALVTKQGAGVIRAVLNVRQGVEPCFLKIPDVDLALAVFHAAVGAARCLHDARQTCKAADDDGEAHIDAGLDELRGDAQHALARPEPCLDAGDEPLSVGGAEQRAQIDAEHLILRAAARGLCQRILREREVGDSEGHAPLREDGCGFLIQVERGSLCVDDGQHGARIEHLCDARGGTCRVKAQLGNVAHALEPRAERFHIGHQLDWRGGEVEARLRRRAQHDGAAAAS